jgi:serine-type D-Ala-D-Ala carboxypeptidase/endopeptidase
LSRYLVIGLLALGACTAPTPRPNAPSRPPETSSSCASLTPLFQPLLDDGWIQGASVALVKKSRVELCSFGTATPGHPANADTLYEIGSLTKLFTGALLMDMVARGEVTLNQPVEALVAPATVPQNGHPITLMELATHRSGLPRLANDHEPRDFENPYADYDEARLFRSLARTTSEPAGSRFVYSNLGAALLGVALAQRARQPYAALVEQRILQPLGLRRSFFSVPAAEANTVAQGYDADGAPRHAWDLGAFAPAGGLHSSARDMGAFVAAALNGTGSAADAMRSAVTPRAAASGANRIGAFFQSRPDGSVWHNGATGGFSSYLAFDAPRGVGVCVLLSSVFAHLDALGDRLLALQRGSAVAPLPLPQTLAMPSAPLADYEGEYPLSESFSIRVFRHGAALYAQATEQSAFRLWPSAADRFYFRNVDAALDFERDANGVVAALTLVQGGERQRAARR